MTWYKDVWIGCDADGCLCDYTNGGRTATEVRRAARNDGWKNDGGDDYCPEHSHLASNTETPANGGE